MQEQRGHADALGHQPGQDLGGEGPAGARHLGRAGLGGVDVLVGGDRPAALHVAVADGAPVAGQVGVQRLGRFDAADPEAHAGPAGPGEYGASSATRRRRAARTVAGAGMELGGAVAAELDRPQPGRQLGREVDLDGGTVRGGAVDLGGQGARRVDHDQVALVEEAGQLGEVRVDQREVGLLRHEHAHGVAGDATVLGRGRRLELGGQVEGERVQLGQAGRCAGRQRGHGVAPAVASSAAR